METITARPPITLLSFLSLLWFSMSAALVIFILGQSFWILRFALEEPVRVYPLVIVLVAAPLFGLLGLAFGLIHNLPTKFSLLGAILCTGFLVFLATDDARHPPAPDFSTLATADSPEARAYFKMAKGAPANITAQIAAPANFRDLFISAKPAGFDAFLAQNHARILDEWNADSLGQAWLNDLAALPESAGALVHSSVDAPILAFQPTRAITSRRLAYACLLASEGQNDEAAEHLCTMLRATYALKRIGVGPVDQMIATVLEKKTYEVIRYLDERIPTEHKATWHLALSGVLNSAPTMPFVAERTILGDAQTLGDITSRARGSALDSLAATPIAASTVHFLARFVIHPNRMEREILELDRELSALVGARKLAETVHVEEAFLKRANSISALRNPGGRKLAALAMPTFHKVVKNIWEAEDSRLELLVRMANPPAATAHHQTK